ncbi:hypothetical protein LINGRAHAP2_LOCUS8148 [Linum grandiflorum]
MMKLGCLELGYERVERVFWLTPGHTMANGLHQVMVSLLRIQS